MEECKKEENTKPINQSLRFSKEALVNHAVASEFAEICRNPVDGIVVSPSALNRYVWHGVTFIRRGIFGGGIFRFILTIPSGFPDTTELPIVRFENSIFHPLIEWKSRKLDLTRSFPEGWKSNKHNMLRVLIVIQRVFFSYEFDCDKCINPEAAILYKEHKDKFKEMAKDSVETSRSQVYDEPLFHEDSNSIKFTPWDSSVLEATRRQMIMIGSGQYSKNGDSSSSRLITTAAEYRREKEVRESGISISESLGKHFPKSYSWFDPENMNVLAHDVVDKEEIDSSDMTSARLDREKFGIEPLDLSKISSEASVENSPYKVSDKRRNTGSPDFQEGKIEQNGEESVI